MALGVKNFVKWSKFIIGPFQINERTILKDKFSKYLADHYYFQRSSNAYNKNSGSGVDSEPL